MKRKLGTKGQVVIPKEIRDALGLSQGSSVAFEVRGRTVVLRPEPTADEAVEAFLHWTGPRLRRRIDLKALLDEEYKVAAARGVAER